MSYKRSRMGGSRSRSRSRSVDMVKEDRNSKKLHGRKDDVSSSSHRKRRSHYSTSSSRSESPRFRTRHSRSPLYSDSYSRSKKIVDPRPCNVLGVFGLSIYTTEETLMEIFSKFGPIDKINIVLDSQTGQSRGFCFIYYSSLEDAKAAKNHCEQLEVNGRKIRVDFSITQRAHDPTPGQYRGKRNDPSYEKYRSRHRRSRERRRSHSRSRNGRKRSRSPSRRRRRRHSPSRSRSPRDMNSAIEPSRVLRVFGLSPQTTDDTLWSIFSKHAPLERVDIIIDPTTRVSKGFCFVTYSNVAHAIAAKRTIEGFVIDGRRIRMTFACPRTLPFIDNGDKAKTVDERRGISTSTDKVQGKRYSSSASSSSSRSSSSGDRHRR